MGHGGVHSNAVMHVKHVKRLCDYLPLQANECPPCSVISAYADKCQPGAADSEWKHAGITAVACRKE